MPPPELEVLFERLGQGVVQVDERLNVVSANRAARHHFHPTAVVSGEPLPEPWPEVSLADLAARLWRREFRGRPLHAAVVVIDAPAPGERLFRLTGFPPDGAGSPALLHIEDRTHFERRSRAEGEFVANAAHELLTPLTGIITAAFALDAGAKEVPEERDRFIAYITTHAARLARISRALLVLARAQSGQEPPRLESVPLRPLLEDAVAANDHDHDSEVVVACDSGLVVFVDRDLAEQALSNLVANAARHARGGEILVSADAIDTREVEIDVVDAGTGITAERLAHMGARFHTSDGRDGGGFGLGVSIAAQAIELLGGTLTYASEPGEGTRARVRLRSGRLAAA